MKSVLFIVTVISVFALRAYSGVHLEPYLGYEFGELDAVSGSTSYTDGDVGGQFLGARVGYGMLGFSAGVDYSMHTGDYTRDSDSAEFDFDGTELGIYAMYELPILLHVYAAYILSADYEIAFATQADIEGSGYKIGAGFTGLPFIAINVEYKMLEFDEATQGATTFSNYANDASAFAVNISLPLNF